ncbi:MAG: hypothetical protein FWG69_00315 [Oscillospiraceae bacterium]|nr:hypothetical protein [Oscillospiraceae bacterium]
MEIVIGLIVNAAALVVLIGSLVIWARKREKKMTTVAFIIRKPMITVYISVCIIVFFSFLFFVSLNDPDAELNVPFLLVIAAFLAISLFMAADTVYWRISVYRNRIVYRALFRKSRVVEFNEITRVTRGGMKITLYSGSARLFTVAATSPGYKTMIDRLNKENIVIEEN